MSIMSRRDRPLLEMSLGNALLGYLDWLGHFVNLSETKGQRNAELGKIGARSPVLPGAGENAEEVFSRECRL